MDNQEDADRKKEEMAKKVEELFPSIEGTVYRGFLTDKMEEKNQKGNYDPVKSVEDVVIGFNYNVEPILEEGEEWPYPMMSVRIGLENPEVTGVLYAGVRLEGKLSFIVAKLRRTEEAGPMTPENEDYSITVANLHILGYPTALPKTTEDAVSYLRKTLGIASTKLI